MKYIIYFLIINLLVLFSTKSLAQPAYRIPADFENNRLYIQGFVNGKACRFLVDTGATGLVFDSKYQQAMGFSNKEAYHNSLKIKLGPFIVSKRFFVGREWSNYAQGDFNGILGWDFFEDYLVEFDYQQHQINLYSSLAAVETKYSQPIPAKPTGTFLKGLFVLPVTLHLENHEFTGDFVVDTGSARNITLTKALAKACLKRATQTVSAQLKNASPHGFNHPIYLKLSEFEFLENSFKNLIVDANPDTEFFKIQGIIGGKFLKNFKLLIDAKHKRIFVSSQAKADDFQDQLISDGMYLKKTLVKDKVLNTMGRYNTKDIQTPIRKEDEIVAVNNLPFENLGRDQFQQLTATVGATLTYTIKRKGHLLELKTELKDLLKKENNDEN